MKGVLTRSASVISNIVVVSEAPPAHHDFAADFEAAISAAGFGKFNLMLVVIALFSGLSSFFTTSNMSYVFPAAQCDLNLSLGDKGMLNAITYLGMISSGMAWGYFVDTLGRRRLLVLGFAMDIVFVVMSTFSQTFEMLMVSKFFGGFSINGPLVAFTAYLSEFHCARHRARMQLVIGVVFSLGGILLPLLAWGILPQDMDFSLFDGYLKFHSWNVFLLITGLPSLISCVTFLFMPESPKFLMTMGKNEKALQVFSRVYSVNTGKAAETYPIKSLVDETKLAQEKSKGHGGLVTANRTKSQALKEGFQQMKPLLFPPYLGYIALVCLIEAMITLSYNTLRLWLPQIFQAINDYEFYNNGTTASLCTMLEGLQPLETSEECTVNLNNSNVYINSMIVAACSVVSYLIAGTVINLVKKKAIFCVLCLVSGTAGFALYFSDNSTLTLAVSTIYLSAASISMTVLMAVIIDLFPTTLRTMSLSINMMFARAGAMSGNLVFPLLLSTGCAPPFFALATIVTCCSLLALFLPATDLKALE